MRVFVSGSRDYSNYEIFKLLLCEDIDLEDNNISIVTGEADGVESMAIQFAKEMGIDYVTIKEDDNSEEDAWKCKIRKMVENSHKAVLFWDCKSIGTKYAMEYATEFGIDCLVNTVE